MPKCPSCGDEHRQRKKDCCPGCGMPVKILRIGNGKKRAIWVTEDASTKELVSLLEKKIRFQLPDFTFGDWQDKDYIRQLSCAKRLLEKCGGNQTLAVQVIETYHLGLPGIYPPRNMYDVLGKKFQYVLYKSKQLLKKEEQRDYASQLQLELQDDDLEVQFAI